MPHTYMLTRSPGTNGTTARRAVSYRRMGDDATDRVRAMGLLDGKRILVTGVLTDASLAFGVAALAQEQGAEVVLTGVGRGLSLTRRVARKLPMPADVLELDVTVPEHVTAVRDALAAKWGRVDGALHAIGF